MDPLSIAVFLLGLRSIRRFLQESWILFNLDVLMLIKVCICLVCSRAGSEDSFCKPEGQQAHCFHSAQWKVNWKRLVRSLYQRLPWYKSKKTFRGADHTLKTTATIKDFKKGEQLLSAQSKLAAEYLPGCKRVLHMQVPHYWQVWRGNRNAEVTALACL